MCLLKNDRHLTAANDKTAVVWTQDNCPWCVRAKNLLTGLGYVVSERNISSMAMEVRDSFKSKFKTVPQVIIGGTVIGGFDATLKHMQRQKASA